MWEKAGAKTRLFPCRYAYLHLLALDEKSKWGESNKKISVMLLKKIKQYLSRGQIGILELILKPLCEVYSLIKVVLWE